MANKSPAPKDIALLYQLNQNHQLELAPEFQRNAVWPSPAKAYLIDTILNDKPIPILFFQRKINPQDGRALYSVIDGQQRLRAIFDFIDNKFRLSQSKDKFLKNKLYSQLRQKDKEKILAYSLNIEELHGYSDADIRDMFARMNKFVVKLTRQELRHAINKGSFHKFVEKMGRWKFWEAIFSKSQRNRMRHVEYAAELSILIIEGPQDKKKTLDLYYEKYVERFPYASSTEKMLRDYVTWVGKALPNIERTRFSSPVDLYGLIGALHEIAGDPRSLKKLKPEKAQKDLLEFDRKVNKDSDSRYIAAASSQTDNLIPRKTRIEILANLLKKIYKID